MGRGERERVRETGRMNGVSEQGSVSLTTTVLRLSFVSCRDLHTDPHRDCGGGLECWNGLASEGEAHFRSVLPGISILALSDYLTSSLRR